MAKYPGGKNGAGVVQKIINQIPPHDIFGELFLGSGAVLRAKMPAPVENFGLDVDKDAVLRFRALYERSGCGVRLGCAVEFLRSYHYRGGEFWYVDPPYLGSTRSGGKIYRHEFMSEEDHRTLLGLLVCCPAFVCLSGYDSDLYGELLWGWRKITYTGMTHAGPAQECLWFNYPEPNELHEYTFLGQDRTVRQNLKRKKERWRLRLASMSDLERNALLEALREAARPGWAGILTYTRANKGELKQ